MNTEQLLNDAEDKWTELESRCPDLRLAIDLQRRLVSRSLKLGATIASYSLAPVMVTPTAAATKLEKRLPVLAGEMFDFDATSLKPFVLGFCEDFATGRLDGPANRLHGVLKRGEIEVGSLLSASLARHQTAIRTKAEHVGVAPDLLWLVAELGVAPLAHRTQQRLLTDVAESHQSLCSALAHWQEGYCPACGSWPTFAETLGHSRTLRCSFCGFGWEPTMHRCTYCREAGTSLLTATHDPDRPSLRVDLCRSCGAYLKDIDVQRRTPFELLAVMDLVTSDLDKGAARRGYTRPSMPDFTTL